MQRIMAAVLVAAALLSGCGTHEPGPGDEAILVDPAGGDRVWLWVGRDVDPEGIVRVPVGTRVRVVAASRDPDRIRGDRTVNVLEGPHAGTAGTVLHSQLGPAR